MSKLHLRMIVPGQAPIERDADEVTLAGQDGLFTVLPNHCALLSRLKPGIARIASGGTEERFAVGNAVCEVLNDRVTVLAERMVEWGDMRHAKAGDLIADAQAELAKVSGPSDSGWQAAHDNLAWAQAVHEATESH